MAERARLSVEMHDWAVLAPGLAVTASFGVALGNEVDTSIELLKPNGPGTSVPDFIAARGEGLFHICLEVENIDEAMTELREKGIRFRTETAQPGHAGSRIAFMDTATTGGVLFELLEAAKAA